MKYFVPIILAAILYSCHPVAPSATAAVADTIVQEENGDNDESLHYDISIPPGIQLDSTKNQQVNITYAYPNDTYKQLVKQTIDTALAEFKKEENGHVSYFEATPVNYYYDDKIVSIRYVISGMSEGAAHPITMLKSVNYDQQRQQAIALADYFSFQTRSDSNLIISILDEEYLELRESLTLEDNPWEFYDISHLDFNIRKDSVCFNFPDYKLGQGPTMMEYKVHRSRLQNLIKPIYR